MISYFFIRKIVVLNVNQLEILLFEIPPFIQVAELLLSSAKNS